MRTKPIRPRRPLLAAALGGVSLLFVPALVTGTAGAATETDRLLVGTVGADQHAVSVTLAGGAATCYSLPGEAVQVELGRVAVGGTYAVRAFTAAECTGDTKYNLHRNTMDAGQNPKVIDLTRVGD